MVYAVEQRTPYKIHHCSVRGRIVVDNDILKIVFIVLITPVITSWRLCFKGWKGVQKR